MFLANFKVGQIFESNITMDGPASRLRQTNRKAHENNNEQRSPEQLVCATGFHDGSLASRTTSWALAELFDRRRRQVSRDHRGSKWRSKDNHLALPQHRGSVRIYPPADFPD